MSDAVPLPGSAFHALDRPRPGHAEVDAGQRPGVTSEESAEIRRLRAEVKELRRANEILRAASAFFAAELDRPQTHS